MNDLLIIAIPLAFICGIVAGLVAGSVYDNYRGHKIYDPLRYLDYTIGILTNNGVPRDSCIKAVARLKRHRKFLMERVK